MADESDIQFVVDNIGADFTEHSWTELTIAERLDSGASTARVVATYWRMRATEAIELVNMSESGSSRSLDSIYARMNELAKAWEAKADLIDAPTVVSSTSRISSFPIKRV